MSPSQPTPPPVQPQNPPPPWWEYDNSTRRFAIGAAIFLLVVYMAAAINHAFVGPTKPKEPLAMDPLEGTAIKEALDRAASDLLSAQIDVLRESDGWNSTMYSYALRDDEYRSGMADTKCMQAKQDPWRYYMYVTPCGEYERAIIRYQDAQRAYKAR